MSVRRLAPPEQQPASFAFTVENLAWAEQQIAKYPEGRQASAVIPILWRAQEQAGGWTPRKAIEYVADLLGMAHIRVLEVATFYTMFQLEPVGRKAHVPRRACCVAARRSDEFASGASTTSPFAYLPTAIFPGRRSSAWGPASTPRWC